MPRVKYQKARKDYPDQGIKKGDMYYYTKRKTGPRSSLVMRSLKPFKASQLTGSPFMAGWYAASEAWGESGKEPQDIRDAAEAIRDLGSEAQESFDNMPEGLQQGETGERLENRASEAESRADELEQLAEEMEGLDEPEEVSDEEADDDWQESCDEYETELARIREEVEDLLGDMPE